MEAFVWTDERIALLVKLRDEGVCAADIGERIGASRNAVLGKAFRLDLPPPKVKPKSTPGPRQAKAKSAPQQPRIFRQVMRIVPANIHGGMRIVRAVETDQPALRCAEVEPRNISLIDLEPNDCRYPYGDGPMTFCGHPKIAGSSYCFHHFHLCRQESRPLTDKRFSRAAA